VDTVHECDRQTDGRTDGRKAVLNVPAIGLAFAVNLDAAAWRFRVIAVV